MSTVSIKIKTSDFLNPQKLIQLLEDCLTEELTRWAIESGDYLRSNKGFNDHTGNLRSSLGAGVSREGKVVFDTGFRAILNGGQGSNKGKAALEEVARRCRSTIAAIMVAGMDYAQVVEDIDSKDVMESRRIQCEHEASVIFERALKKAIDLMNREK